MFVCPPHDLIAKLDSYCFKNYALCSIFNYWNNVKERVKQNSPSSSFENIIIEIIKNSLQGKPSEIVIDNRLTFEPHMKNLCKKAGRKRHALARIPNYMVISKKCSIINAISFHNSRIVRWYGGFTVENLLIE